MPKIVRNVCKPDLARQIERKFGSLTMLVSLSGMDITPEVERFLTDVQNSRDPVRLTLQHKGSTIVLNIT